jgi:hypothetical protein
MFERSLEIWRKLGDREQQARDLNSLGIFYRHLGDADTARSMLEAAIAINREIPGGVRLGTILANLGQLESAAGASTAPSRCCRKRSRSIPSTETCSAFLWTGIRSRWSACAWGRPAEARDLLSGIFDHVASSGNTAFLVNTLEVAAAIAVGLNDPPRAPRLAGAAMPSGRSRACC